MNQYQWIWNGKAIPIEKLHLTQLNSINKTLIKNKGSIWFNIDSSDWRVAIRNEWKRRAALELSTQTLNKLKPYKTCVNSILQRK